MQIENNDRIYELFVGKDWGDFKPKFEKIDSLKIGDNIELYFDDNYQTETNQINSLTQYVDKNGEAFFIKGPMEKTFAAYLIGFCFLGILFLIYLKRIGKIS